ncbi:hypothetical protein Dimus_036846, partial [Dionaea muscipula]
TTPPPSAPVTGQPRRSLHHVLVGAGDHKAFTHCHFLPITRNDEEEREPPRHVVEKRSTPVGRDKGFARPVSRVTQGRPPTTGAHRTVRRPSVDHHPGATSPFSPSSSQQDPTHHHRPSSSLSIEHRPRSSRMLPPTTFVARAAWPAARHHQRATLPVHHHPLAASSADHGRSPRAADRLVHHRSFIEGRPASITEPAISSLPSPKFALTSRSPLAADLRSREEESDQLLATG